jgi:hypothetical protein
MPGVAAHSFQLDIGDDRTHTERRTGEVDTQHTPHEAAAAIGAGKVSRAQDFVSHLRGDTFGILRKAGQLAAEFWPVAEPGKTPAHDGFSEKLRHHQRRIIRLVRGRAQARR